MTAEATSPSPSPSPTTSADRSLAARRAALLVAVFGFNTYVPNDSNPNSEQTGAADAAEIKPQE